MPPPASPTAAVPSRICTRTTPAGPFHRGAAHRMPRGNALPPAAASVGEPKRTTCAGCESTTKSPELEVNRQMYPPEPDIVSSNPLPATSRMPPKAEPEIGQIAKATSLNRKTSLVSELNNRPCTAKPPEPP